jgi:hypothetical protein
MATTVRDVELVPVRELASARRTAGELEAFAAGSPPQTSLLRFLGLMRSVTETAGLSMACCGCGLVHD